MPYNSAVARRRNYANSKKRRYYRKPPPTRGEIYGKAGSQLYKDVMTLKNLINVEFKVKDTTFADSVTTSSNITLLNGLTTGDDISNRDGRQVRFKSFQIKGSLDINAAGSDAIVRMILFIDKAPHGTTVSPHTLLINPATINGLRSLQNRKRFVILRDKTFALSINGVRTRHFDMYVPLDMKTIYNASSAGTIADMDANALYIMLVSDTAAANPTFNAEARLRFIDN